jgi:N-methylhydantoinase A
MGLVTLLDVRRGTGAEMSGADGMLSIVAVDTGGTFTDVVLLRDGALTAVKVPSTPADPAEAVLAGLRRVLQPGERFLLVHGSTVATNTLLERRGARVALVTNRGFEDVLEIGRQNRPQLYALLGTRPPPLVPAADRHGIAGRLGPDGAELEALDDGELAALAARLAGVDAAAVCLLHAYADPAHEERVAAALVPLGVPVSLSSTLLREYREFERTATTVVNAYVAPRVDRYLGRLEAEAGAERIRIMGSGGGALDVARARREPVHTVLSGPAGGVVGALAAGEAAGLTDLMTFDMGGTSTDVALCPGRLLHTREFAIAGLPVAVPVLDIHTVGAGGGSIAWLDAGGALRVGPASAGAVPGPVAYGLGGTDVTVTDAHVWLGRLPADALLGGERTLDRAAIEAPLARLAAAAGLAPDDAAEGILEIADTAMEGALRVISVERAHDPADFTLVPFGGAAGLHAARLAERLGMSRVLLPPLPGVLSAYGMLAAPVRKDAARTVLIAAGAGTPADDPLAPLFAELDVQALAAMVAEGIAADDVVLRRTVDARYRGQSFELSVPAAGWTEALHEAHRQRYGFARPGAVVEAVTLRVEATAAAPRPPWPDVPGSGDAAPAAAAARGGALLRVREHGASHGAARHDRALLAPGTRLRGPAVITEYSATTWLPRGWTAEVLAAGGILLTPV